MVNGNHAVFFGDQDYGGGTKKGTDGLLQKGPVRSVLGTFFGMFWRGSEQNFLDITFGMISCHLDM